MDAVCTKNGRPLKRVGDDLIASSGNNVARLKGDRAFGPDGRYVGTLVNDRLVYRRTHSAWISSSFSPKSDQAFQGQSCRQRVVGR